MAARAPSGGATLTVMVTTAAGCPWAASSIDSWITVASGQRTGSGSFDAVVAQNTGAARSGRIVTATASIVIEQDAAPLPPCTLGLVPSHNPVPAQGGDFTLDVTTEAHCKWEASSADDWLGVPRAPAAGSGRVRFGVRPNTGDGRTGRIVVGTSFVDIVQEGCVTAASPDMQRLPAGTSSGKLGVTAPDACVWSVKAPAWIHGLPASGKGSTAFAFRVEANTGRDRTGTIEIGGRTVQVFQAGS